VSWKPTFPSVPAHPAQQFDFRVAEMSDLDGERVGYLMVIADPYARQEGHLWWKTLTDPYFTLEFCHPSTGCSTTNSSTTKPA
jgi:hypothetical protein